MSSAQNSMPKLAQSESDIPLPLWSNRTRVRQEARASNSARSVGIVHDSFISDGKYGTMTSGGPDPVTEYASVVPSAARAKRVRGGASAEGWATGNSPVPLANSATKRSPRRDTVWMMRWALPSSPTAFRAAAMRALIALSDTIRPLQTSSTIWSRVTSRPAFAARRRNRSKTCGSMATGSPARISVWESVSRMQSWNA